MIELIIQLSDGTRAVHQLKDSIITIGREADNVIVIADGSVSRHHAEIKARDGIHTLRDLNSANGTTVNDEPITEWTPGDGDVLRFGTVRATWAVRPSPPTPAEPVAVAVAVHPLPGRRRALILATVLLVALLAIAFLVHGRRHANGRTQEVAAVDEQKGQKSKTVWDKIHQIEAAGNAQGKHLSFGEYPKLKPGVFDFRWFDDKAFESFLEKLDTRNKNANQVATEISNLDKRDVDADLSAYSDELCSQWKSASALDMYFAQYVSTLYQQHKNPEQPPSQDEIQTLERQWLTKLNEHQTLTTKVIAREASTATLLTGRYHLIFKL